jgi:hypothetical protein
MFQNCNVNVAFKETKNKENGLHGKYIMQEFKMLVTNYDITLQSQDNGDKTW